MRLGQLTWHLSPALMAAAASGDCPANSSHRGVITFPGEMLQEEDRFRAWGGPGAAVSCPRCPAVDSPVDSDLMDTLVHRHRLCHGDYRPLVDKRPHYSRSGSSPKQLFRFWFFVVFWINILLNFLIQIWSTSFVIS